MREYIAALHSTYLDQVRHLPPGERAALPLGEDRDLTVAVVAARQLHLIALASRLPAVLDGEVDTTDRAGRLTWTVRFYDPSVLPELGLLDDDEPGTVRRVLGVVDPLYHLTVSLGGGLSGHHAHHSGVALSNQHAQAGRDLERLRAVLPGRERVVDEFGVCVRSGLDHAASALARSLSDGRVDSPPGTAAKTTLRSLVAAVVVR